MPEALVSSGFFSAGLAAVAGVADERGVVAAGADSTVTALAQEIEYVMPSVQSKVRRELPNSAWENMPIDARETGVEGNENCSMRPAKQMTVYTNLPLGHPHTAAVIPDGLINLINVQHSAFGASGL